MNVNIFKPKYKDASKAHIKGKKHYNEQYYESINNPENFWATQAERLHWMKKWTNVANYNFNNANIKWFEGGKLNACYNCIDRHVISGNGDKIAIIWESNDPNVSKQITYKDLLIEVSKFSNVLINRGIKKGDRVCIYMQMIPELAIAMLACARIGAIHSIVFGAFSADALAKRINDSSCKAIITQDAGVRGLKNNLPMKENVDIALNKTQSIESVFVVQRTKIPIQLKPGRDYWWHKEMKIAKDYHIPIEMDAEDPLFILYTSGSTGTPKGIVHSTGGYLVYSSYTHKNIFDYQNEDIYWCTADIGWITGHSYVIYGPLSNQATTLMYEGVPNYPDFGRFWDIIQKHKVNIFYTAPTALRALMKEGDKFVKTRDKSSLKLLGTVGEPIKKAEWLWYYKTIGQNQCPIIDTWWQTETGGILISPLPAVTNLKPGSATLPFFGIKPVILSLRGEEIKDNPAEGLLAIKTSWPGQMRTIYGDHKRFYETYFSQFNGYYFTGDGARRDENGYYWITGRIDDVLNVAGHRLGTAELEGAIGMHADVAEAAVVGYTHDIKGQGIYAYVTLMTGISKNDSIIEEIKLKVRELIGPHATPDKIQITPALPKTRSGKIMRRILKKIADGDNTNFGDISTLADPDIINNLINNEKK